MTLDYKDCLQKANTTGSLDIRNFAHSSIEVYIQENLCFYSHVIILSDWELSTQSNSQQTL